MERSKRDMGNSELTNCTARLMLAKAGRRKLGGTREAKNTNMTVASVYAPTAKAPRVFGCLKEPIFQHKHLSVETKRAVY